MRSPLLDLLTGPHGVDRYTELVEPTWTLGEARARAIVKGRPYSGRDDLVKRKIIPQSVYDEIKDQIIARQK